MGPNIEKIKEALEVLGLDYQSENFFKTTCIHNIIRDACVNSFLPQTKPIFLMNHCNIVFDWGMKGVQSKDRIREDIYSDYTPEEWDILEKVFECGRMFRNDSK